MRINREYRAARMNTFDGACHLLRVRFKILRRQCERIVQSPEYQARLAQIRAALHRAMFDGR